MKDLCKTIKPYICPKCGNDSLFFITYKGNLLSYKNMMINGSDIYDIKALISINRVSYIKCLSCNKVFLMDWTKGFPIGWFDKDALSRFLGRE